MINPLLVINERVDFNKIQPEHIEPAIDTILEENRKKIDSICKNKDGYSWNNLVQPLEDLTVELGQIWSAVSHLNNVCNTEEIRKAYNACLPKLTTYNTELGQNEKLFEAYQALQKSNEYHQFSQPQKKVIENALRDFRLAGVNLPQEKKKIFQDIQEKLASFTTKFEENLLDATDNWQYLITNENDLEGIPLHAINTAKLKAERKNLKGWLLGLDFPSYYSVITYANNRSLREKIYEAYVTRASELGPNAGLWDNSDIMVSILDLRQKEAELLGYDNYAELSLVPKMAKDNKQVKDFLWELVKRSKSIALQELEELSTFAREKFNIEHLEPWDVAYTSEKLQQEKYNISQEALRAYFPLEKVLEGLFLIVNKLYNVKIIQNKSNISVWHPDVTYFDIFNDKDELIGGVYFDLYAREQKRGGAWMDDCRDRHKTAEGELHLPIAFLTCNFTNPQPGQPSLLTHDEVLTLFHEFGHSLHHLLTKMDIDSISGIHGVAWDAVELPSQFMENWCWYKESIDLISCHFETKEKLPEAMLSSLLAIKNFQSAMQMLRQLEFSLFDFNLHEKHGVKDAKKIQAILDHIRHEVSIVPVAKYNRFQHSFSHIFAGGYAAGYYSYKWAEVLSADVFTQFKQNGIFNRETGQLFLNCILSQGGSRDAMELFVDFMGREPDISALLKDSGIE